MQATAAGFSRIYAGRGARRMPRLGSAVRTAGATLLAFGLAACETAQFAPPPDAARTALSGAALAATQSAVPTAPGTPIGDPGEAAAHNAGEGGMAALAIGVSGCFEPLSCVVSLALGAVVAPFALAGGAIAGASNAHGEAAVAETDAAIRKRLAETDLAAMVSERLLTPAMATPGFALTPAAASAADVAPGPTTTAPTPELRLTITRIGFLSEGEIEPDVWLMVTVRGEVLDGSGAPPLYWRVWQYRGRAYDYFELAEKDAALLEAELDHAATKLAERIRQDLFVATAPERKLAALGEADTVWTIDGPLLPRDAPGTGVAATGPDGSEGSTYRKPLWMDRGKTVPPPLLPTGSQAEPSGPIHQPGFIGPI